MVFVINLDVVICQKCAEGDILKAEASEVSLVVMTKSDYVNRLRDTFHAGSRRFEVMVKSGVVAWPFDPVKVKPKGFEKVPLPCDACGIGKSTRASFKGKEMTEFNVGFVW